MTVKELSTITGKNRETILNRIKELIPDLKTEPRKKIILNDEQSDIIIGSFPVSARILEKSTQKVSRILHLTQRHDVRYDVSAATLDRLAKYMTPDEIRAYVLHVMETDKQITAPEEPKRIESPGEDEKK